MAKILIVEDDAATRQAVVDWLGAQRYVVESADSGGAGQHLISTYAYDLVILDWQLPEVSGIELCRQLRADGKETPVLMLTGKAELADKTRGLDCGASDYLTKPFDYEELSARVRALLRRVPDERKQLLEVGVVVIDLSARLVTAAGCEVKLLPREFALLAFLSRHVEQVFTTEALLLRVWSDEEDAGEDAVFTCIKRLRQKLGEGPDVPQIRTVHGAGYKLTLRSTS